MLKSKMKYVIFLVFILVSVIFIIKNENLKDITVSENRQEPFKDIVMQVYSNENEILKVLVIVEDTENGIDKVIYEAEQGKKHEVLGNGKVKVVFDYEIKENGNYEFRAVNGIGQEIVKTFIVDDNYRNNLIDIYVNTEKEIDTKGLVTIDYNTSEDRKKMYKIGDNGDWIDYRGEFEINSYEILKNNLQDVENRNIKIYLKIEDNAGNKVQIEKKITNIDVDIANVPQINILNVDEYPTITKYGIINHSTISIDYDSRKDITNYYSIDNGNTWQVYSQDLNLTSVATIIAKSVKNTTGLEVLKKEFINASAIDAVRAEYYDGSDEWNGYQRDSRYINIDNSVIGKKLFFNTSYYPSRVDGRGTINAINEYNQIIDSKRFGDSFSYTIIEGTKKLNIVTWNDGVHYTTVNEIRIIDDSDNK